VLSPAGAVKGSCCQLSPFLFLFPSRPTSSWIPALQKGKETEGSDLLEIIGMGGNESGTKIWKLFFRQHKAALLSGDGAEHPAG